MKKPFAYALFSLAFVFSFSSTASADVIPDNSHSLNRCVKVVNLDKFPDIALISYVTGPMVKNSIISQINNNECLTKGYKFNSLKVYWNTKNKADSIDPNNLLLDTIEVYGGYVDQKNPLVKEDVEYSIAGFSGGKLVLYKSQQISEYNNGTPKKIESFTNPLIKIEPNNQNPEQKKITQTPTPSPEIVRGGFWQSIACFFGGLFGKGCQ